MTDHASLGRAVKRVLQQLWQPHKVRVHTQRRSEKIYVYLIDHPDGHTVDGLDRLEQAAWDALRQAEINTRNIHFDYWSAAHGEPPRPPDYEDKPRATVHARWEYQRDEDKALLSHITLELVIKHCNAAAVRAAFLPILKPRELQFLDYLRTHPQERPRGIGQNTARRLNWLRLIYGVSKIGDMDVSLLDYYELSPLGWKVLGYEQPPMTVDGDATVLPPVPRLTNRRRGMLEE